MSQTPLSAPPPVAADVRSPALWAHRVVVPLRAVAVLFTVDTLVQAAIAALFVEGDVGLLRVHDVNAHVLVGMAGAQTVLATVAWRARAVRVWPAVLGAVLVVLMVVEHLVGYARQLAVHIPLGVGVFGGATVMAVWAFTLTRPLAELKRLRAGSR